MTIVLRSRGEFHDTKIQLSDITKQFAILKNRFHTSGCTQSKLNQTERAKHGRGVAYHIARASMHVSSPYLDCVHTMPAYFENGEKCDG